jgi:hypothetical protein
VRLVEGNAADPEWSARSKDAMVDDGTDPFFILNGRIVARTVH